MIDQELKKRLVDYFDAGELADLIGVTTEDIVEMFEDQIEECQDDLVEFMDHGTRRY